MSKFTPKTTGRTAVIDDGIYVVQRPPNFPRCYIVAWLMMIALSVMHALTGPWESLYWLLIMDINVTFALFLAWLFDDRGEYELWHTATRNISEVNDA